jgi:hypothetical protein
MIEQAAAEQAATLGGVSAALATFFGQVSVDGGGWMPLIVQAGMAGIVVMLVMRHIPQLQASAQAQQDKFIELIRSENEQFRATIKEIADNRDSDQQAWRDLIARRGYCPVRDHDMSPKQNL